MRNLVIACCLSFGIATHSAVAGEIADAINSVAEGDHRSAEYKARNKFRNPGETLEFFGIRPDMTVVEISPGGGGWYTEILAPYLKDGGKYYAASFDPESDSEYQQRNNKRYKEKLAQNPELYGEVLVTVFSPPHKVDSAPANSADMVLTFRNMHGWMRSDNQQVAMRAMYDFLKPGGILGFVQHRGDPSIDQDEKAKSGYIREDVIIELAESVGFMLEAKSEINANPKDTKDHPQGVWNLPPSYEDGDKLRDKYQAIGESDRMTLKFRKPV